MIILSTTMKLQLQLLTLTWIALLLWNVEGLRYLRDDLVSEQYDENNMTDYEHEGSNGLFNKNRSHEIKGEKHIHRGLARWGEEYPYATDSELSTQKEIESHESNEAEYHDEAEEKGGKEERPQDQTDGERVEQDYLNAGHHHHEGLVNWGQYSEYEEYNNSVIEKLPYNDLLKNDNATSDYYINLLPTKEITHHRSTESAPITTSESLTSMDNHHHHGFEQDNHHYHYVDDSNNSDNVNDKWLDKHTVDHLVDPLLSEYYLTNSEPSVPNETNNNTNPVTVDSFCAKCIKWQQLHSTLPCILYPLNFDIPEQVNQSKLIYVYAMRKIVAQINKSLHELLLDLQL
ncbi:unnamed protein product [Heterobilharzia americana]|nr:unnamed protein product [Heterobilharzia americana]